MTVYRNRNITLFSAALLIVAGISYWSSTKPDRIYQAFKEGEINDLPILYTRGSEIEPTVDSKFVSLLDLMRSDQTEGVLEELSYLLEVDPSNVTLLYYQGVFLERAGHYRAAIETFQLVRYNSTLLYEDALKKLALLYIKMSRSAEAMVLVDELIGVSQGANLKWAENIKRAITS